MSTMTAAPQTQFDTATIMGALYGDGIIGLRGAFSRKWAHELSEDIEVLLEVRQHLTCRVVNRLEPIVQAHTIEGLVMGEA
jgi:hypothetical protein